MLNKNKSFPYEENEETDEVKNNEYISSEEVKKGLSRFINAVYTASEEFIKKQSSKGDANIIIDFLRKSTSLETPDYYRGDTLSDASQLKNDMPSAEDKVQQASSSARARELYEQSVLLRDEMAKLNGGKQSMAILYELYLENKGSPSSALYKRGFEIRQEQLKVALREYKAVKEELDALPGAEAYRFDFPKDLYVYEELSRIELNEDNMEALESQSIQNLESDCETEA